MPRKLSSVEPKWVTLTYGTLPSFEQFKANFEFGVPDHDISPIGIGGTFDIHTGADGFNNQFEPYTDLRLDVKELWKYVKLWTKRANFSTPKGEMYGQAASDVLQVLGIEWV